MAVLGQVIFLLMVFFLFVPLHAWSFHKLLSRMTDLPDKTKIVSIVLKSIFVVLQQGITVAILIGKDTDEIVTAESDNDDDGTESSPSIDAFLLKFFASLEFLGEALFWVPVAVGSHEEWFQGSKGVDSFMNVFWTHAYDTRLIPDWTNYCFALLGIPVVAIFFGTPITIAVDECSNYGGIIMWIVGVFLGTIIITPILCCVKTEWVTKILSRHTATILTVVKTVMVSIPLWVGQFGCNWELPYIVALGFLSRMYELFLEEREELWSAVVCCTVSCTWCTSLFQNGPRNEQEGGEEDEEGKERGDGMSENGNAEATNDNGRGLDNGPGNSNDEECGGVEIPLEEAVTGEEMDSIEDGGGEAFHGPKLEGEPSAATHNNNEHGQSISVDCHESVSDQLDSQDDASY